MGSCPALSNKLKAADSQDWSIISVRGFGAAA
jgi:hypothetical protein